MIRSPDRFSWWTLGLLGTAVLLPMGIVIGLPLVPPGAAPPLLATGVSRFPVSTLPLEQLSLGPGPGYRPIICNVQIVDLDRDGIPDILVCDGRRSRVIWYRQAL